jgi:hypothetical protein
MISSNIGPKTKHQLSQAILKLRQPELSIHEVLDKQSANAAKKAIDKQAQQHSISVVLIRDRYQ